MKHSMNDGLARRLALAASIAALVLVPGLARAAAQTQDIGAVQLVRIWATGTPVEAQTRDLFVENPIFRNEVVETVRDGGLHLRFKDDTEFRLGSNSRATLDKFVYDPDSRDGELALSLKEGVFRFKTGQMKKEGIRILTAVAEIEVHGTDLTVEVLDDGTIRVTVTSGEASMTSRADGTKVVMRSGDGGQVAPGGPAEPYAGLVGAGDLGIAEATGFELAPTISTASTQFDGGLTQLMYQSASAGQTISALSPLAVFTDDSQQALETVVTGESPFAAAPSAPSDLVAFAPTVVTDGTITDAVSNAVTNSVINAMTNAVTDTQLGVGFSSMGGFAGGNGGFETGDFTGFSVSGDAAIVSSLGRLMPPEGNLMAFFSTGNAAVNGTTSSIMTDPFNLPTGVNSLTFEFNFLSNEYPDFVGAGFNDTLTVTINGTQEIVLASVDSSKFVDAKGTGYNGMTGFETTTLDISQFSGTDDVTVEFEIVDKGDSGFDSAGLLDNLVLE